MKVYIVFKQIIDLFDNTDDLVLDAVFSKKEYAKQYCDKHNEVTEKYWYEEEYVDEELEDEELEELLNETDN